MSVATTVKKVSSKASPHGDMDHSYLVSGKRVSLRLWLKEKPQAKPPSRRDYETVGFVLAGSAELVVEGQTVMLEPGDAWLEAFALSEEVRDWLLSISATTLEELARIIQAHIASSDNSLPNQA